MAVDGLRQTLDYFQALLYAFRAGVSEDAAFLASPIRGLDYLARIHDFRTFLPAFLLTFGACPTRNYSTAVLSATIDLLQRRFVTSLQVSE